MCNTCILRTIAFCLYPDLRATAVPSPSPRSACRGSCSGPPVTAWCANLLSRQPPRSWHAHISAARTARVQGMWGARGLPAARGLLQRCPPSRCAPVSRARSRQASLQIPRQHRLCPTATTRRCHITYGMLMPCCALSSPSSLPPPQLLSSTGPPRRREPPKEQGPPPVQHQAPPVHMGK